MASLYNLDYESNLLGGILQWPELFSEISFLDSKDFGKINSPIWQVIVNTVENKGNPTPVILAEKLKSIGISLDGIEIYDYLEGLRIRPIDKNGIISIAKELKKLTLVRTTYERAIKLQQEVVKLKDSPAKDIIKCIDENLGKSLINLEHKEDEAVNLYEEMPDLIEEIGNNPEEPGYRMPYPTWSKLLGNLRQGSMYIFGARPASSKSTLLLDIGQKVIEENKEKNIKILYLDTELTKNDQIFRLAAQKTKTPYALIESGKWRYSEIYFPKMREALDEIRKKPNKNMWFKQVGSMGMEDLSIFIKNWFYKNVGRGGNALLIYDYLKVLGSDKGSNANSQEWERISIKCQLLKDIIDEINCPLLTAIQLNRSGIIGNKTSEDLEISEASFSLGDRVNWLAAFTGILRKKTPDEILRDGIEMGSHCLHPIKKRYIGYESSGHHDLVRTIEKVNEKEITKYKENYLLFNIDNFSVDDRGDYRNLMQLQGKTKIKLDNKDHELL